MVAFVVASSAVLPFFPFRLTLYVIFNQFSHDFDKKP